MGVPVYGLHDKNRREELAAPKPGPEVLGVIKPELTDPTPQQESALWTGSAGEVEMVEPPPPWEVSTEFDASDARHYIDCPANWSLRWINPKLLDSEGWRHWQSVMASDSRVKCKVQSMISPDGTIRRGGTTGDILSWMYTSWVLSRRKMNAEKTARQTQSAVDQYENLQEEFKRGTFSKYVKPMAGKHPRFTSVEGRSIKDD